MCWLCYLVHLSSMACGKHFALGKEELKGCLSFASWINKWAVNVYSALSHSSPRSTSMFRDSLHVQRDWHESLFFNLGFSNSFGWFKSLIILVTSDEWHFLCWKSAPINVLYRRVESVSEELSWNFRAGIVMLHSLILFLPYSPVTRAPVEVIGSVCS